MALPTVPPHNRILESKGASQDSRGAPETPPRGRKGGRGAPVDGRIAPNQELRASTARQAEVSILFSICRGKGYGRTEQKRGPLPSSLWSFGSVTDTPLRSGEKKEKGSVDHPLAPYSGWPHGWIAGSTTDRSKKYRIQSSRGRSFSFFFAGGVVHAAGK